MKVLVLGSGGREHALCWALRRSPRLSTLYCAPGNGGIAEIAECIALDPLDAEGLIAFSRREQIDLAVIGPEAPLAAGIADRLEAAGIATFGPSAEAARLEGSKGFMKDLCARHDIPTARYGRFSDLAAAEAYIRTQGAPIVIKADGLAAGKGVVVAASEAEAIEAAREILGGKLGAAGSSLVIEECLVGEEVSFFALVDGEKALPLASAQDHKTAYDGDRGPNTGGMGAYSPAPAMDAAQGEEVMARIVRPTVRAMAAEGHPFKGVLFAGLMLTAEGPKLIEYNVRFGDPECQVLMLRLESDLLEALLAAREGRLDRLKLSWRDEAALCVVLATKGYPGAYERGSAIAGLDAAAALDRVTLFHAGTRREGDKILADGGRVLGVAATGANVSLAQARAYEAVDRILWPQGFCRRDIGWRAIARESKQGGWRAIARESK